jgi:hypothetical protein
MSGLFAAAAVATTVQLENAFDVAGLVAAGSAEAEDGPLLAVRQTRMSGIFGETVSLGQENGPDVRLVAFGDEFYARYETPDGYAAVYDPGAGLFVYGRLSDGRLVSTAVPVSQPPPPGLEHHLKESNEVRQAKAAERAARTAPLATPGGDSTGSSRARGRPDAAESSSEDAERH